MVKKVKDEREKKVKRLILKLPGANSGVSSLWYIIGPVIYACKIFRQKTKTLNWIRRL